MKNKIDLISQSVTYKNFIKSVKNLSSCILLTSQEHSILQPFAKFFAMNIICKNETPCFTCNDCQKILTNNAIDILCYPKFSESFSVEDVENIITNSIKSPFDFDKKIFIINNINNSSIAAQNKLLKTLEEINNKTIFILTTSKKSDCLPTIISRCNEISIPKISKNEFDNILSNEFNEKQIDFIYELTSGQICLAYDMLNDTSLTEKLNNIENLFVNINKENIYKFCSILTSSKESFKQYLELIASVLNLILQKKQYSNILNLYSIEKILNIANLITECNKRIKSNINEIYICDNLLINIMEAKND